MTDAQLEVIKTLAWCVVLLASVQAVGMYAVVRILITGRSVFDRKPEREPMRGFHDASARFTDQNR